MNAKTKCAECGTRATPTPTHYKERFEILHPTTCPFVQRVIAQRWGMWRR